MGIRQRNRKCALSRWKKVRQRELGGITPDKRLLARICGFLAGDGSVQVRKESNGKEHHSIEFFPDDASLIEPFTGAFEAVFHKTPRIFKSHNHYRLRIFSKSAVTYLREIGTFGVACCLPPASILTSEESAIEWLRAYFDSEAYVGTSCIRVQSVNKEGLALVGRMLGRMGITINEFEYVPKNESWSRVYILVISKKSDRLKFLNKIGFNHKRKRVKLLSQFDNADVA